MKCFKQMRAQPVYLIFGIGVLFYSLSAHGVRIRVLFRSSHYALTAQERDQVAKEYGRTLGDLERTGHVAIELPPGTRPGGNIFGWGPIIPPKVSFEDILWRLKRDEYPGKKNGVLGSFNNDTAWAEAGLGKTVLPTLEMSFEVTPEELQIIVKNMDRINNRVDYQLIPGGGGFNCVTVLPALFEGTSVKIPEVPVNGSLSKFIAAAKDYASYWGGRCGDAFEAVARYARLPSYDRSIQLRGTH